MVSSLLFKMKYDISILLLVTLLSYGCSRTTFSVTPSFGYTLQDSSQLIVAKFQNAPNDVISENATEILQHMYQGCTNVKVIPYDTVQDILYQNVTYVDPIWEVDTKSLIRLYKATKARYLLVGKVLDQSADRPPVSIAKSYGNVQVEERKENWIMLQFTLYDLATTQKAFELHTRAKARQYDYKRDDGSILSFHAPSDLLSKAFSESKEKLVSLCECKR